MLTGRSKGIRWRGARSRVRLGGFAALAAAALCAACALAFPTAALADGVALGGLTLTGDGLAEGVDYSYDDADGGVVTILTDKPITIANTAGADSPTSTRIVIPADVTANLVLAGVNISSSVNSAITLTPQAGEYVYHGSEDEYGRYYTNGGATCHITLADGTENTLQSTHGKGWYAALRAGESTTLTIDDATPDGDSDDPGSLTCAGRNFGAGIGGSSCESGGNITIDGGIVTASVSTSNWDYGYAAGIGGGAVGDGGNITINGGIVTATGTYHGAGIGGGCYNPYYLRNQLGYYEELSPAAVNKIAMRNIVSSASNNGDRGYSGNITINGGYIKSTGGSHGCAFGDGCIGGSKYAKDKGYVVRVNGGTVLTESDDEEFSYSGFGYYYSYDLGCLGGTVIVTGGSLLADHFVTNEKEPGEEGAAYDDYEGDGRSEVFKTNISMAYLHLGERGLKVTGIKVTVGGKEIVYNSGSTFGMPSYTDPAEMFYLWLPSTSDDEEVSVELTLVDVAKGEEVETDPFYITHVYSEAYLKQYVTFEIPGEKIAEDAKAALRKRYDGLPFTTDSISSDDLIGPIIDSIVSDGGVGTTNPVGGHLDDRDAITFAGAQLMKDVGTDDEEVWVPDTSTGTIGFSDVNAGGRYRLTFISDQYADADVFSDSYWGHRAYYDDVIITPADTQTSVAVTGNDGAGTGPIGLDDELTITATVTPHHGCEASGSSDAHGTEALTCEAPIGTVQLYITDADGDRQALGEAIELAQASSTDGSGAVSYMTDEDGYMYSTATLTATLAGLGCTLTASQLTSGFAITAEYACGNGNYTASEGSAAINATAALDVAVALSSNVASAWPDGVADEVFKVRLSDVGVMAEPSGGTEGAPALEGLVGAYGFSVTDADGNAVVTEDGHAYSGKVVCSGDGTVAIAIYEDGAPVEDAYADDSGVFRLRAGDVAHIEGLPSNAVYNVSASMNGAQEIAGYAVEGIEAVVPGLGDGGEDAVVDLFGGESGNPAGYLRKGSVTTVTVTITCGRTITMPSSGGGGIGRHMAAAALCLLLWSVAACWHNAMCGWHAGRRMP